LEIVLLMRITGLLQDRVLLRGWDVARAAKGRKAGFFGWILGYFFNFSLVGEVRARVVEAGLVFRRCEAASGGEESRPNR
jgi:hypothetical protein